MSWKTPFLFSNTLRESFAFSHFCEVGLSILTILPIFDYFWGGGWRGKGCVRGAWMGTYLESHIVCMLVY